MIEKWIHQIPNKFSSVKIDYYVVMPDHIHMILAISGKEKVSTDFCSCVSIDKIIDDVMRVAPSEFILSKNILPMNKKAHCAKFVAECADILETLLKVKV